MQRLPVTPLLRFQARKIRQPVNLSLAVGNLSHVAVHANAPAFVGCHPTLQPVGHNHLPPPTDTIDHPLDRPFVRVGSPAMLGFPKPANLRNRQPAGPDTHPVRYRERWIAKAALPLRRPSLAYQEFLPRFRLVLQRLSNDAVGQLAQPRHIVPELPERLVQREGRWRVDRTPAGMRVLDPAGFLDFVPRKTATVPDAQQPVGRARITRMQTKHYTPLRIVIFHGALSLKRNDTCLQRVRACERIACKLPPSPRLITCQPNGRSPFGFGHRSLRSLSLVLNFVSGIAAAVEFRFFGTNSGGPVNYVLTGLGLPAPSWQARLSPPSVSRLSLVPEAASSICLTPNRQSGCYGSTPIAAAIRQLRRRN